jgi:hypothetical protein
MLLKSALKRIVGKIKEWFLEYYSILGCDASNFNARTCKQESDTKSKETSSFTKPHGVATSQGSDLHNEVCEKLVYSLQCLNMSMKLAEFASEKLSHCFWSRNWKNTTPLT